MYQVTPLFLLRAGLQAGLQAGLEKTCRYVLKRVEKHFNVPVYRFSASSPQGLYF